MKKYVAGLLISAIASAGAFGVVIVFINPVISGWLGPTLLLSALYIFMTSLTTLLGFIFRVWRSRNEIIYANLAISFRQGLLLSLVLVGSLVLQLFKIFNIWSGVLFVVAVILIELAFQSQSTRPNRSKSPVKKKRRQVQDVVPKNKQEPWQIKIQQK